MKKIHFGVNLEDFANLIREVNLHLNDGWAKDVPIIDGNGKVISPKGSEATKSPK